MKLFAKNITFLLVLALLAGCEKFELDDHCPENEGPMVNPQELRVNDDTDSEDEVKPGTKSLSAQDNNLNQNEVIYGTSGDDGNTGDGNDDDLVNDDSDDEDEGVRPRVPGGSNNLGGSDSK